MILTRWRFGLKRRFVATIEWLRWFPKPGFFPQIAHTLDIAAEQCTGVNAAPRSLTSDGRASASAGRRSAEVREDVRHLERGPNGFRSLLDPIVRLLDAVEREHAERDRDPRLECGELESARGFPCDVVEMGSDTPDDAPQSHDAREATRLGERGGCERELERARNDHDRDRLAPYAGGLELVERARQQTGRHGPVETCDHEADGPVRAVRGAFENGIPVGNLELPGRMLLRELDRDRLGPARLRELGLRGVGRFRLGDARLLDSLLRRGRRAPDSFCVFRLVLRLQRAVS